MKHKFFVVLLLFSHLIFSKSYHCQLIVPTIDTKNPAWNYAGITIREHENLAFHKLIMRWNDKLMLIWRDIQQKFRDEIGAGIEQIDYHLNDNRFITTYMNFYRNSFAEFIHDENEPAKTQKINALIANFIENKLNYVDLKDRPQIILYDKIPFSTYSFGTHAQGHYLILNKSFYNPQNIKKLYDLEINKETFFIIQPSSSYVDDSKIIDFSNLFHLTLTLAIASIRHQGDYYAKMLKMFIYGRKQLSVETQDYGEHYISFRSYLEACLQSQNPLEAAIFVKDQLRLHQDFLFLWQDFIADLEHCYNQEDLENYYKFTQEKRRENLYNSLDKDSF